MMTEVRSYNGHGDVAGRFASRPQAGDDFLAALQDAVRENPLSAALIGMGVAWMFMGGGNVSLFGGNGRKSIFGMAAQGADQFTGTVRSVGAPLGANMGRAAQAVTDPAWQAGSAVAAAVGDAASRSAGRAADGASSGYQAAADMASGTVETLSNATTAAASAVQDTAAKWTSGAQRTLSDILERQPLWLGAVGLAVGAGIAASLPTTEAEKQVMGEASDFVREKAAEVTGQVKQMADAALDEAKAQGITQETVGNALQSLTQKMSNDQAGRERTGSPGAALARGKSTSPRKS